MTQQYNYFPIVDAASEPVWESRAAVMSTIVDRPDRRLSLMTRARNYCGRIRGRATLIRAAMRLLQEWLRAWRMDLRESRTRQPRIVSVMPGADALGRSSSVAIYVHYSRTPTVSPMVLGQLQSYRALGFQIHFVSMAPPLPDPVLAQVANLSAVVVQRRNVGLDFGAWQDMLPFLNLDYAGLKELLLVNDSVCGPLRPLEPILADMRESGPGFFGMTENLAPKPHLQSYFLLARGGEAIADTVRFLTSYRQTAYKRRVIRRGEIGITCWMRARGHTVSARFGYQSVEDAALASPIAQKRLKHMFPRLLGGLADGSAMEFAQLLRQYPLNPAHSLWRELVEICGFPFLKTELLVRNPIGVCDMEDWRQLLPSGSPELGHAIAAHLSLMH